MLVFNCVADFKIVGKEGRKIQEGQRENIIRFGTSADAYTSTYMIRLISLLERYGLSCL